jgi:hypothetical protein
LILDETTRRHTVQAKVFIGPPWADSGAATFWDWSSLNEGDVFAATPAETTAPSGLATNATTLTLPSGITAGWPTAGGFWIEGKTSAEAWERIEYTGKSGNTLTGLVRETIDAEQTGVHGAGARVRFWWEITTSKDELTLSERLDNTLCLRTWTADIAGAVMPQAALRNFHLVVVALRGAEGNGGDWSDWVIVLVGWLIDPKVKDDAGRAAEWTATIGSLGDVLALKKAHGLRVTPRNMAREGTATGSTALAAWYKESHNNEFLGSPSLAAEQCKDDDMRTLYVSEQYLTATDNTSSVDYAIDQLHITYYPGQGKGYRWISFLVDAGSGPPHLYNKNGNWPNVSVDSPVPHRIIYVENLACFEAENPVVDSGWDVVELNSVTVSSIENDGGVVSGDLATLLAAWWDDMDPAGGYARIHNDYCFWGTETPFGGYWTGAACAAPLPGQTIRRLYAGDGTTTAGYSVGYVSYPGQWLDDTGDEFYLLLEMPPLGLTLTNDITTGSPGASDTLYISIGDTACVNGLDSSGTLQIDLEQITYSAKTAANDGVVVTARGANGTTAAAHPAESTIKYVEGGLATDVPPVATVYWKRTAGKPVPKNFVLYGSRSLTQPAVPPTGYWTIGWTVLATVTNNAASTWTYTHSSSTDRYKWFMLVPHDMTTDPYRFMLNEFGATVADYVYATDDYLASGTIYAAMEKILLALGVPTGAIIDGTGTPTVGNYTTAPTLATPVLADVADMSACLVSIGRDSKITIAAHPFWPAASYTEDLEWTRATAKNMQADMANGRKVSQVIIAWETLDGLTSGTARYPANPDAFGEIQRIGPYRYVDQAAADAAAQKRYWQLRRPFGWTVEPTGAPWSVRPCVIQGLQWQLDSSMLATDRTHLVDTVTHRIAGGALESVVHLLQISRQDER